MLDRIRLHRSLAQDFVATVELAEELIVQSFRSVTKTSVRFSIASSSTMQPASPKARMCQELSFLDPLFLTKRAMRTSRSGAVYNRWTQPSYEIKVRGKMHLWGSAGITQDITFDKPLLLHLHNDLFGEVITFGRRKASGTEETIGTLKPGEFISIPLNDISGVFASCEQESTVCCLIK